MDMNAPSLQKIKVFGVCYCPSYCDTGVTVGLLFWIILFFKSGIPYKFPYKQYSLTLFTTAICK